MIIRMTAAMMLSGTLAGCMGAGAATTGAVVRAVPQMPHAICGQTRSDQNWIDDAGAALTSLGHRKPRPHPDGECTVNRRGR